MAKTIYITEAQLNTLKKYIQEEENSLEITVTPDEGETVDDAIANSKENIEQVAGSQVAADAKFTLKGNAFEGKSYTKKEIEKSRLHKTLKEGKKYTKEEFTKHILNK